jgi:hypothetical protein
MIKKISANIAAVNIVFLCASIFLCLICHQPIATVTALKTIKLVLIVGKIGREFIALASLFIYSTIILV